VIRDETGLTREQERQVAILEIFVEARWPAGRRRGGKINALLAVGYALARQNEKWKKKRAELRAQAKARRLADHHG
jgi:hypothetical protein